MITFFGQIALTALVTSILTGVTAVITFGLEGEPEKGSGYETFLTILCGIAGGTGITALITGAVVAYAAIWSM